MPLLLTTRVNPTGYPRDGLETSAGSHEVRLARSHWIVDKCLDDVNSESQNYCMQEHVFQILQTFLDHKYAHLCMWAVGGSASGKSYTLFGDGLNQDRGVVFRTINHIFGSSPEGSAYLLLTMYLIDGDENIVDVLDNCRSHSFQGSLGHSTSLGVMALPVKPIVCDSAAFATEALQLGLIAATCYIANTVSLVAKYQTVVSLSSFDFSSLNGEAPLDAVFSTITFIETSPLEAPVTVNLSIDRLAGYSIKNLSARSIVDATTLSSHKNSSVLSYLLDEALENAENIFIGCLRSNMSHASDNVLTLDFMNSLSESQKQRKHKTVVSARGLTVEQLIFDLNNERRACEELLKLKMAAEKARQADLESEDDPAAPRHTHDPAWHAPIDNIKLLTKKLDYLNSFYEILRHPRRAMSYSLRDLDPFMAWLTNQRIHLSKATKAFFTSKREERSRAASPKSTTAVPDSRPHTADSTERPVTPMNSDTPSTPYFQPITSCGYGYPPLCITITPGYTAVRAGQVIKSGTIRDGDTEMNTEDRIHGKVSVQRFMGVGLDPVLHCFINRSGDGNSISLEPYEKKTAAGTELLRVFVNGVQIKTPVELSHGDVVCFGECNFMQLHVPTVAQLNLESDSLSHGEESIGSSFNYTDVFSLWEKSLLQRAMTSIFAKLETAKTAAIAMKVGKVDRYKEIMKKLKKPSSLQDDSDEDDDLGLMLGIIKPNTNSLFDGSLDSYGSFASIDKSMDAPPRNGTLSAEYLRRLSQVIVAVDVANRWAVQVRKERTRLSFHFKVMEFKQLSSRRDVDFLEGREVEFAINDDIFVSIQGIILCESLGGSWTWDFDTFTSRLHVMSDLIFDLGHRCNNEILQLDYLYLPLLDPWKDTYDDELVGVACLFLGSLMYLIDINETLALVSYKGYDVGYLKLHARAWIDEIAENPAYITIDKETDIAQFIGSTLVIRFNFENLISIPQAISSNLFVQFRFYHHELMYKTARYHGKSCSPRLDAMLTIKQEITHDFVEYIQRESVDLEIWGRRDTRYSATNITRPVYFMGEPEDLMMSKAKKLQLRKAKMKASKVKEDEEQQHDVSMMKIQLDMAKLVIANYKRELHYANKLNEGQLREIKDLQYKIRDNEANHREVIDQLLFQESLASQLQEELSSSLETIKNFSFATAASGITNTARRMSRSIRAGAEMNVRRMSRSIHVNGQSIKHIASGSYRKSPSSKKGYSAPYDEGGSPTAKFQSVACLIT